MVSDSEPRYRLVDADGNVVGSIYAQADGTLAIQEGTSASDNEATLATDGTWQVPSVDTEMLNNAAVVTEDRGDELGAAVADATADQKALTNSGDLEGSPLPIVVMPRSDQIFWDLETPVEIDQNAHARLIGWGHIPVKFQSDLSEGVLLGPETKLNFFEMAGFNFDINGHNVGDIIGHAAGTRCTFRDMNYTDLAGGGVADSFIALDPAKVTGDEYGYNGTVITRCHYGGGGEANVQFDLRHDGGSVVSDVTIENCRVDGSIAGVRARSPVNCHFNNLFHTGNYASYLLDIDTEGAKSARQNTGDTLVGKGASGVLKLRDSAGTACRAGSFRNISTEDVGTGDLVDVDGAEGTEVHINMSTMSTADAPYVIVGAGAEDIVIDWPTAREAALDTFVDDSGTRTRVNDVATEAANAEEPQGAYNAGTMVQFNDTGDGSGTGLYIIDRDETPQGPL